MSHASSDFRLSTDGQAMDAQRLSIRGRILQSDELALQDALASIHETPERPRCLCVPGGVEMYVAYHHPLHR